MIFLAVSLWLSLSDIWPTEVVVELQTDPPIVLRLYRAYGSDSWGTTYDGDEYEVVYDDENDEFDWLINSVASGSMDQFWWHASQVSFTVGGVPQSVRVVSSSVDYGRVDVSWIPIWYGFLTGLVLDLFLLGASLVYQGTGGILNRDLKRGFR